MNKLKIKLDLNNKKNNKKEMNKTKFKCIVCFPQLKNEAKIKSQIELNEHYIHLSFLSLSESSSDVIKGLFYPIYNLKRDVFYINYSLINEIKAVNDNKVLIMEITNPVMSTTFSMSIFGIECQSLLFRKKMNKDSISKIQATIEKAIKTETKYMIEKFLAFVSMFRECLEPQKKENHQIENLLINSYIFGKNYYEKYTSIYKQNMKIKTNIKKQLDEQIKRIESMLPEQEIVKQSILYTSFDSLINEFKIRTSLFIEESIVFFFQIINTENNLINFKKIDKSSVSLNLNMLNGKQSIQMNKSTELFHNKNVETLTYLNYTEKNCNANVNNSYSNKIENYSISTKTTSKQQKLKCFGTQDDLLETPKFYSSKQYNNIKGAYDLKKKKNLPRDNLNKQYHTNGNNNFNTISKQVDALIKYHLFVPPIDVFSIFLNTAEIIHRKFFEMSFRLFFGDYFVFELDKDKLIKIDSMYNYFLYLRSLKGYLFSEKNKMCITSMMLLSEDFCN